MDGMKTSDPSKIAQFQLTKVKWLAIFSLYFRELCSCRTGWYENHDPSKIAHSINKSEMTSDFFSLLFSRVMFFAEQDGMKTWSLQDRSFQLTKVKWLSDFFSLLFRELCSLQNMDGMKTMIPPRFAHFN
jgi:hypothetical protein